MGATERIVFILGAVGIITGATYNLLVISPSSSTLVGLWQCLTVFWALLWMGETIRRDKEEQRHLDFVEETIQQYKKALELLEKIRTYDKKRSK